MKQFTNEEIEAKVRELWAVDPSDPERRWDREVEDVEVVINHPHRVLIEISAMYEQPSQRDEALAKLAEFFGTPNADIHYDIGEGGCETCDYGSRYGFAVQLWAKAD